MSEQGVTLELVSSIRAHARSVLIFVAIGVVLAGVLFVRQAGLQVATVDLAGSNDIQLLVGQELPPGVSDGFAPTDESFYINHAYSDVDIAFADVSAGVAGDAVVVSVGRNSADEALAALDAFLAEYLPRRNAPTIAAYETAFQRTDELASFYEAEVARLDEQLQDDSVSESALSQLAILRSNASVNAATTRADATSYEQIADGEGPIVVVDGPRIQPSPLSGRVLVPFVVLLLVAGIGMAQAWFRDAAKVSSD